jgi:hypothetical protein
MRAEGCRPALIVETPVNSRYRLKTFSRHPPSHVVAECSLCRFLSLLNSMVSFETIEFYQLLGFGRVGNTQQSTSLLAVYYRIRKVSFVQTHPATTGCVAPMDTPYHLRRKSAIISLLQGFHDKPILGFYLCRRLASVAEQSRPRPARTGTTSHGKHDLAYPRYFSSHFGLYISA